MKTNKYKQVKSIQDQSSISGIQLDSAIMILANVQVSLVFPVISTETQTSKPNKDKQVKQSDRPLSRMQIALIVIATDGSIISHSNVSDFNKYLESNLNLKQVNIKSIQISKLNKVQTGKSDTIISAGKNVGKKSETTILQQAIQEAQKKYSKFIEQKNDSYPHFMLLDLYKYAGKVKAQSDQQILQSSLSQVTPELNSSKQLTFPQFVQRKYDGLRCGAFRAISNPITNGITLLSRGHKEFTTLNRLAIEFKSLFDFIDQDHVTLQLFQDICRPLMQTQVNILNQTEESKTNERCVDQLNSYNLMIDGELYIHQKSLQILNSIIRNSGDIQVNSKPIGKASKDTTKSLDSGLLPSQKDEIQFMAYDIDITLNNKTIQVPLSFKQRLVILDHINEILTSNVQSSCINVAPTVLVDSNAQLNSLFDSFIAQQYEGAVIRSPESQYCYSINNRRSPDSVKYKLKLDMEVLVLGFIGGQGKDANAIIYQCCVPTTPDQIFQVVQNTTYDKRKSLFTLLNKKPQYAEMIKKVPLNIEYANLSSSGVPQQPRGIYFRTESIDFELPDELFNLL